MTQALDLSNCGTARFPWEGSYGSTLMSRRTERPYQVDGAGELARHSAAQGSAPEINGPVVQQEFTSLLREICGPSPSATPINREQAVGAEASNDQRETAEVSRGHSSEVGPSRRPELVSGGSTAAALPVTTKPTGRVIAQRLLQLEHGASSEDLLERVLSPENLQSAWLRVKANGGAAGVEGMTIAQFPAFARQYWQKIRLRLLAGTYHPAPVRRVFIPKPNGDLRPLGIPTVLDRVIQQAIAQILAPIFDPHFSTHSYGFRYGKRAHQAVRSVQAAAEAGYGYAVDCDLKSFFDTVKFDRLMRLLARRISDVRVLRLIGAYLRAGVQLPEGTVEATTQGVPQGGPLSPLLANIMLDPLDKELERRGLRFARYADDFLVLVKSLRAAQRVMQSISRFVEGRLKLVVNRQKSRAARLSECAFLGFQILRGRIVWTEKALQRFKERIQEITSRSRGVSTFCMLRELKRYAVGWMNYFGLSQAYRGIPELDQWVRRRVRMYYWKQWKRARTRRRQLIRLGIHRMEVYKATRAHRGYWFMAGTSIVQRALDNRWLAERGVPSLKEQWVEMH
jgi:RNA-directed DNA polymerase